MSDDKYPIDLECPNCGIDNQHGQKNIQALEEGDCICHECQHMWDNIRTKPNDA